MRLVYWLISHKEEDCYSIVAKTKKAAIAEYNSELTDRESYLDNIGDLSGYVSVKKIDFFYRDAFHLFYQSSGEGLRREGSRPVRVINIKIDPDNDNKTKEA
jgi:hypothetical protein